MTHFARFVVVIVIVLACETLIAQLPTSRLDLISPVAGKIGSKIDVTISGGELDESNKLVFTTPGITATQKLAVPDEIDPTALPIPRKFTVHIASNVKPGVYEVRASGPLGTTNPRAFAVGNLETIAEAGNHRTPETAMELPLGAAVTGTADVGAADFYEFTAKKSQRFLIDCYGQRIDSRIDATLVVYNSDGARIEQVRDVVQLDPVIDFVAPYDGEYYVGVHDFEYSGGKEYFYRLSVHEGPFVSFVFPPVGTPGSTETFLLYGHHLPGGSKVDSMVLAENNFEKISVDVAMGDPSDSWDWDATLLETPRSSSLARKLFHLQTPQGSANAVAIGYATAPVSLEQEPNDQIGEAQKVDTPCEFVGQFYPHGDRDVISFEGKKGNVYWIELLSNQLGASLDAHMLIEKVTTNETGEQQVSLVAEVDDQKQTVDGNSVHAWFGPNLSDPSYKLTADADATYRVTVKDLYGNTNNNPLFVYRLLIRHQQPDFHLLAYAASIAGTKINVLPSATTLPSGGNTTLAVQILRSHGFEGAVEISAEGLPEGIVCHGAVADGKVNQISLIFSASENATAWSGPIRVIGKAKIGDREVTRLARNSSFIWGTQNALQQPVVRIVNDLTLSVPSRQKAPLSVQLGDGTQLETSLGGKVEIPIKVVRGEDVPGDLKMKMVGIPGVNLKETVVKANEGKYPLEVTVQNFPTGIHTVHLTGTAKYKYKGDLEAVKNAEEESKRLEGVVKQIAEQETQAQENLRKAQEAANKETDDQSLAEIAKKATEESARLNALSKRAVQRKQQADKHLNDTKNKNLPRDVNIPYVSTPVRLHVVGSPVTLQLVAPPKLKQSDETEITATIEKKFGFDEQVNITVEMPSGVTGISAIPLSIEKGKTEGKLKLVLAANAATGTHFLKVRTKLTFNNVKIETTDELVLTVDKFEQAASN